LLQVAKAENMEIDGFSISIRSAVESLGLAQVISEVGLQAVIAEFKKFKDHLTDEEKEELRKLLE
jgi:hypothetical protein